MSLFERLFRRRKAQPSQKQIVKAVLAFVKAQTWEERKQIVKARRDELLADAVDRVFATLLEQAKGDVNVIRILQEYQVLLARCRCEGIEAAFADRLRSQEIPDIPPDQAQTSQKVSVSNELTSLIEELQSLTRLSDMARRVEVCQAALRLVDRGTQPGLWVALQGELANSLAQNPLGNRADNLEQAIQHFQQTLEVYTRVAFPEQWAMTQNNLANAYRDRIRGARVDNLEQAIQRFQQALEVYTCAAFPEQWAMTQHNLALVYADRIRGVRADNLEQAIHHCQQALEIRTHTAFPEQWAMTQHNLATAYAKRIRGTRADNLEQAIQHCQQALEVYTRDAFPEQWAMTQHNLADTYAERIRGVRADNLEQAIQHFQQTLEVYTRAAFPEGWAMTQHSLANAYQKRIRGVRADNLEQAIHHCQQALEVYTREAFPEGWASTQNNLANAYADRIRGERAENLEQAIQHCQQALEVYTRDAFPKHWAMTQHNLADTYAERIRGVRADNLEQAIQHYQQALEVRTHEAFPVEWARTMQNLGTTYKNRIRGARAENLEQAIQHYQQALEIYTRESLPEDWAMTQHNLALAHQDRIRMARVENLEQAIQHYQLAMEVYTREAFPESWARTTQNLGTAYRIRIQGEQADNLEQAIQHYQQALEVYTREAFPESWARTQNNLALAYQDRIRGERADNLEQAIQHYQLALEVRTRDAFPEQWAITQHNLANAYQKRIRGVRADSLEQAIQHFQQALEVHTREAFPEGWASTQNNLANAYADRIRGERADNLEQAIQHYQQALEVYTREAFPEQWAMTQNNLAKAYADRIRGKWADNLEQAIQHFQQALEVYTREASLADRRKTLSNLGYLHFGEGNWEAAHEACAEAIELGEMLLEAAYTEIGRQAEVGEVARLYARTAYCLLHKRQPAEALLRLEQGKTRLLAEALALSRTDLTKLSQDHQQMFITTRETIRALEAEMRLPTDTPARRDERELSELLYQNRHELRQMIDTIRRDHPDFMPVGLNVTDILKLIPQNGALIAPLITSQGGAVFVIPYGVKTVEAEHVFPLDSLTDDKLISLSFGSREFTQEFAYRTQIVSLEHLKIMLSENKDKLGWQLGYSLWKIGQDMEQWHVAMETFTVQLWELLMKDVHQHLQEELQLNPGAPILLMPQGKLGLLPLHAAWREVDGEKRYFLDDYQVTYIPSAYALSVNRQRVQEHHRHQRSLCAVVNPTKDLLYTPAEGEAIRNLFDSEQIRYLSEDEATVDAVMQDVSGQSYVHFSCHGFYDWQEAMHSGLVLAEKKHLTLSDIIAKLDLSAARLVTLSACETGMTEFGKTPDEYIGLPAGFLQAGASGVISTLWAVNDLSTMLLMERFYQNHLQKDMEIAEALRQAQLWLRDVTAKELRERFSAERGKLLEQTRMPAHIVTDQFRRFDAMQPDERPFAHPFYWAAFTFSGA